MSDFAFQLDVFVQPRLGENANTLRVRGIETFFSEIDAVLA